MLLNKFEDLLEFGGSGLFEQFQQGHFSGDDDCARILHSPKADLMVFPGPRGDGIGRDKDPEALLQKVKATLGYADVRFDAA